MIVEDNVICFPALTTAGVPFVRIASCNPLEMKGEHIPPPFSGYPADDRTGWAECLHFGKPMIVLPLFWDQYDNAQRVTELGYGVRLDPYRFTDAQLHEAMAELLGDSRMAHTLTEASATIRARDGLRTAADLIERSGRGLPA